MSTAKIVAITFALGLASWAGWSLFAKPEREPQVGSRKSDSAGSDKRGRVPKIKPVAPESDSDEPVTERRVRKTPLPMSTIPDRPLLPGESLQPTPPPVDPGTLEEARENVATYFAELRALKAAGETLDQDAFLEHYKRGNDLVDAMGRKLDLSNPAQGKEHADAAGEMRNLLFGLQAKPAAQ